MDELQEQFNELIGELYYKQVFFKSSFEEEFYKTAEFEVNEEEVLKKLSGERVLYRLLYFTDNLEIKPLSDYRHITDYQAIKTVRLTRNCLILANLKDTIGNATFKIIFEKYIELLNSFIYWSKELSNSFKSSSVIVPYDPTYLLQKQLLIYELHLNEIKKLIDYDEQTLNIDEVYSKISKVYLNTKNDFIPEAKQSSGIKPFRDYIIHKNKVEIENIVKEYYSDFIGTDLRFLIEYFMEHNILLIPSGQKAKFLESISELFEKKEPLIRQSIFSEKVFNGVTDVNYKKMKRMFDKSFEGILL